MRRNTTFGVDFQEQVEHYHSAIPPLITKSLKEIERRGINVKVGRIKTLGKCKQNASCFVFFFQYPNFAIIFL